jgi:hypothetical protein
VPTIVGQSVRRGSENTSLVPRQSPQTSLVSGVSLCPLCLCVSKTSVRIPHPQADDSTTGNRSLSIFGAGDLETQRHRGHGVDWPSRTRRKTLPCARDVFREYSSGGSLKVKRLTESEGQRDFALARSFAAAMSCQQSFAHPVNTNETPNKARFSCLCPQCDRAGKETRVSGADTSCRGVSFTSESVTPNDRPGGPSRRAFDLLNLGWPGLDRRDAPVCWPHTDFRGFAQSGSNPGHPILFTRLRKAKALAITPLTSLCGAGTVNLHGPGIVPGFSRVLLRRV